MNQDATAHGVGVSRNCVSFPVEGVVSIWRSFEGRATTSWPNNGVEKLVE